MLVLFITIITPSAKPHPCSPLDSAAHLSPNQRVPRKLLLELPIPLPLPSNLSGCAVKCCKGFILAKFRKPANGGWISAMFAPGERKKVFVSPAPCMPIRTEVDNLTMTWSMRLSAARSIGRKVASGQCACERETSCSRFLILRVPLRSAMVIIGFHNCDEYMVIPISK